MSNNPLESPRDLAYNDACESIDRLHDLEIVNCRLDVAETEQLQGDDDFRTQIIVDVHDLDGSTAYAVCLALADRLTQLSTQLQRRAWAMRNGQSLDSFAARHPVAAELVEETKRLIGGAA